MSESKQWFWLIFSLVILGFVYYLSPILMPFLLAFLLSYMSNPLVNIFVSMKMPRTLAIIIVFIIVAIIVLLLMLFLVPKLERQIALLLGKIPQIIDWIQASAIPWLNKKFGIQQLLQTEQFKQVLASHWREAGSAVTVVLKTITQSGFALVAFFANLFLVPVVAFYLLRDWSTVWGNVTGLLPRQNESTIVGLVQQCNEVLGAFFRGQLLVMLGLGIIYSTGLMIMGLDLALLIGLLAGLVSIVPYLGFVVGISAASVAAIFQFHDTWHLLYVFIVFAVGQTIESTVLTPLLVGDRIGLHPIAVIFAIMAGGQLFGFFGILLALPVAAVLMVWLRHFTQRYRQSAIYN